MAKTMKAAVLTGIGKIDIREVPVPVIRKASDVLLKVATVGVCGSDIHYYKTGRIGSQKVEYPYRIGHEFSGTVVATGKAVKTVKKGDRVAVDPAMFCGKCDQCLTDRRHTCRHMRFLGCPGQVSGCLCEYILMPETSCYRVKKTIPFERAMLVEPLTVGYYAVQLFLQAIRKRSMAGTRIGILGCGPIGLSVMLSARAFGAKKIYVTDKIDSRLKLAMKKGACWTGHPDRQDVVTAILKKEPLGMDVVFECCGQQEALNQAVELLKPGGQLSMVGIHTDNRISFRIEQLRRKELVLQNVRRQNECIHGMIDFLERGRIKPDFMVTHRFPLEKAQKAFDLVAGYRDGVIKAVVQIS